MSSLLDSLRERFPCQTIEPYGKVIAVPSRLYRNEWDEQLKAEGYKTFMQALNGETHVFIRLEKQNVKPKKWSPDEVSRLKEFVGMGLDPSEIASKLGRTRLSVIGKIQRMGLRKYSVILAQEPNPTLKDSSVKEFLACVSEIYPRYPNVCALLLKQCINKILPNHERSEKP